MTPPQEMSLVDKARQELETSISGHLNIIIDMKHKLNQLTVTAKLPPEILTEIFVHYVAAESKITTHDKLKPYVWVRITHVCHHWREVALTSPRVWSTIFVTGSSCVDEMLSRSKKVPLDVFAGYSISRVGSTEKIRTVLRQLERIRRLELHYSPSIKLGDLPTAAPLLKTLLIKGADESSLSPSGNNFMDAFERCDMPILECLELTYSKMLWTSRLLRPTLTSLVFGHARSAASSHTSLFTVLRTLDSMPLLQRLDIRNVLPRVNEASEVANIIHLVTLDRLSDLRVTDWGLSCAQLLSNLSFPGNTALIFDCELLESHMRTVCDAFASKLSSTNNGDRPNPILSVSLYSTPYTTTGLRGWHKVHPIEKLATPELIPAPHFDFAIRLPTHSVVVQQLFEALPLSSIQSLYVDSTPAWDFSLSKDAWMKSFASLIQLRQLSVGSWGEYALPEVLSSRIPLSTEPTRKGGRRRMQPFFPKLSVLRFENTRLRDPYNPGDNRLIAGYRKAFQKRKKSRAELERLVIRRCLNFFAQDMSMFDGVVKEVDWDQLEEVDEPETDTEMYEDFDDLMDPWDEEDDFIPWDFPGAFLF
ncbi:hypothetical protein EIP86_006095 [Pleurotus ostreatoroseus]|nr:hypothetical protein EIP86_006095 [Pleurotus ostreatoroseus]